MSTKFFTNQDGNSLLKKFEGVFENIESIRHFDALVGYFRASGYFKVRPFLNKIPKIRILVGIDVDALTKQYHDKGQLYLEDSAATKDTFMEDVIKNIQGADYEENTEKGIIQFLDDLINNKIEMRAHPKKTIHAKVYIFRSEPFNEYAPCEVITGSSNLTDAGLGANPESNYEFNVSLRDYEDVKFSTDEFEKLWAESVPILQAEAEKIKKKTYLKDDFTPFDLYIKMLMEYFGKRVDYDPYNIDMLLPDKYMRLKYQSDAANQGFAIMMKHNGFILADVVGLGKTIIASMVIKKFIYENGTHTKVLIVVPPAIKSNWQRTAKDFQLENHFRYITIGSLGKILDDNNHEYPNPEEFDLIVVDESHKFRNDNTGMYNDLQDICKRQRSRPSENGDTRKKVILISATPLNNRPEDIESQLYLFQDKRSSTLENIHNLQEYFKKINDEYKKLSGEAILNIPKLKLLFEKLRNDVIEPLVIRRTRTDIERNKEYLDDIKAQGLNFPKVDDPIPLYYELDPKLSELFLETVELVTGLDENGNAVDGLEYYRYRAIEFLKDSKDRDIYGNVESISSRLKAIMKILLVKRLESSFFAFTQSLIRLDRAIDNMMGMLDEDRVFIAPDLDINKLMEDGFSYEEIEAKINEKGGNNREFDSGAFQPEFYELLSSDKKKVANLLEKWKQVKTDPKLEAFAEQIDKVFFTKKTNPSGKLVIFTESKETAMELQGHLKKKTKHRVLSIAADNRQVMEPVIRSNFDANLEEDKWQNDYDIVVTTEVLAEGINLHRSSNIVNYDVPWNSTRLMQRIGRVNRIGSRAKQIYVYNYYPSAHGDAQIRLVSTALRKLQAFHTAFGEDNKIFSLLEETGEGGLFGSKIKREESEILIYLNELREFRKKNPKRFTEISSIPNKARCGRAASINNQLSLPEIDGDQTNYSLKGSSLSYLKSENHPGIFCLITDSLSCKELNFLQAVKLYKASEDEKSLPLHEKHHAQIMEALDFFKTSKNQENIQNISRKTLSPAENKAIANLNAFINLASTPQKRNAILRAIEIIKKGSIKALPKAINDFYIANNRLMKIPAEFIDALFLQVLDKHAISTQSSDEQPAFQNQLRGIINPKIVLTQSYT